MLPDGNDPWANWVGLAGERAPLVREAAQMAQRAGRPHAELEAHAAELERFAPSGYGNAGVGGGYGAEWAERRARDVENFIQGLELVGDAMLTTQKLRGNVCGRS